MDFLFELLGEIFFGILGGLLESKWTSKIIKLVILLAIMGFLIFVGIALLTVVCKRGETELVALMIGINLFFVGLLGVGIYTIFSRRQ